MTKEEQDRTWDKIIWAIAGLKQKGADPRGVVELGSYGEDGFWRITWQRTPAFTGDEEAKDE